jgi:hypothetical protein
MDRDSAAGNQEVGVRIRLLKDFEINGMKIGDCDFL